MSTPAVRHVLQPGANYSWYKDYIGMWFGPDDTVNKGRGMPAGEHTQWKADFDKLLTHYYQLGIRVMRISLLGNAWNYGREADDKFEPLNPDSPDPTKKKFADDNINAYRAHYLEILKACDQVHDPEFPKEPKKIQIIPSLIGFDAFRLSTEKGPPGPDGKPTPLGGGGRAKLVNDQTERNRFLKYMLGNLLADSAGFEHLIYCWELISEPIWVTKVPLAIHVARDTYNKLRKQFPSLPPFPAYWPVQTLTVEHQAMIMFIRDGLNMIEDAGFRSTVGNVFIEKIALLPIPIGVMLPGVGVPASLALGDIPADDETFEVTLQKRGKNRYRKYIRQFHWYPEGVYRRTVPPWGNKQAGLGETPTRAIVGEISPAAAKGGWTASPNPMDWSWPDLDAKYQDTAAHATRYRLDRLERRGYALAMLWPDAKHGIGGGNTSFSPGAEAGVVAFRVTDNPF
jgi:hypothetical protein